MDLRTAAARLGVHYQTAYRWVRHGTLPAVKRGSSYDIDEADLEAFLRRRTTPLPPPDRAVVRDWDHQVARFFEALVTGDELGARAVIDRLTEGNVAPLDLCDRLVAPTMGRIGAEWATGAISVAVEHRASAICERILARVVVHPRGRPRGTAVVASVPGEEHGLPTTMATLVLRGDRWQVHHLGTQVPPADLIDLVGMLSADLVVLSNTDGETVTAAKVVARQLEESTSARVLVGGPGDRLPDLVAWARETASDSGAAESLGAQPEHG